MPQQETDHSGMRGKYQVMAQSTDGLATANFAGFLLDLMGESNLAWN